MYGTDFDFVLAVAVWLGLVFGGAWLVEFIASAIARRR